MTGLKQIDRNPPPLLVRRFGWRTVAAAPVAGLVWLVIIRLSAGVWHLWLPLIIAIGGLGLGLLCALAPQMSRSIHVVWHIVITLIDWIITGFLLSVVYFLVLTPIGWLFRLAGRQTVRRRPDQSAQTYWENPEKVTDLRRYYRQY
jgi:hypothetical protein